MMHQEAQKFGLSLQVTDTGFALFTTKALREGDPICDVTCLWYSTKDILKQILSQEGNKAMLDKLMLLEGLYQKDVAARFFGIRVGCAAWARHYLGVRKGGPNAKVVINSKEGFTSRLAQLVVSTRNNLGISQDTEICLNYGTDYDFGVLQEINESPCKKFKGVLAGLFEKQEAEKEEAEKEETKKGDKRKAEGAEDKETKKAKRAEVTEGAEGAEGAEGKATEDNPAIIAKDITDGLFELQFKDGTLSLHANANAAAGNKKEGNKKVPPGTVLYVIRDGGMKKVKTLGGVLYHLDPKTSVMIAPNEKGGPMGLGGKPLTLKAVVDKLKIKTIDEFTEFVLAGQMPDKLTTANKYWFVPKDLIFQFACARVLYKITFSIWGEVWPALIYIYRKIYIYRERERKRESIHIYIFPWRERRERYTSWYIMHGVRFGPHPTYIICNI